jgi:TRAP-type C4-dicarboxylate transport system permease small subunit
MRPVEPGGAPALVRGPVARLLDGIDRVLVVAAIAATVCAGLVLTYSVFVRGVLHWSTDWQDEISVFLLVGATFLSAPWVQARRGHIAIEAVSGLLSPAADRVRLLLVDTICLAFTLVFGWQCWSLFVDAIQSGEVTDSVFAPPLWFPYSLMTGGITLLACRFGLQAVHDAGRLLRRNA